jgi:hypothetical protein
MNLRNAKKHAINQSTVAGRLNNLFDRGYDTNNELKRLGSQLSGEEQGYGTDDFQALRSKNRKKRYSLREHSRDGPSRQLTNHTMVIGTSPS